MGMWDGIPDGCDVCPADNPDDSDGDGVCDSVDICPGGDDNVDGDGDGIPDACDAFPNDPDNDVDGDLVSGEIDNCPNTANAGQEDLDADDIGDACDLINIVTIDTTLVTDHSVSGDVIVQSGNTLTIPSDKTLTVNSGNLMVAGQLLNMGTVSLLF